MQSVRVRDVVIGEGIPKICVPIVAKDENEAICQAEEAIAVKPDIIEFRADHYGKWENVSAVIDILRKLRESIGDVVLLFTFRTKGEGGNAQINASEYLALCTAVCESGLIDLIDVEAFFQKELLREIVSIAHDKKVYVVASNHDFQATPDLGELVDRLTFMDENCADILKIAVMPDCEEDVITLMSAVLHYRKASDVKPVIALSMGGQGTVSRLVGEFFGSAITFASADKASAPGQMPAGDVRNVLEIIHRYQ